MFQLVADKKNRALHTHNLFYDKLDMLHQVDLSFLHALFISCYASSMETWYRQYHDVFVVKALTNRSKFVEEC